MPIALLPSRAVLALAGSDARKLLQGLVTNDMDGFKSGEARYAALLAPQGKILFDFFVVAENEQDVLIDCAASSSGDLLKRLVMYRLRAKVDIALRPDLAVAAIWNEPASSFEVRIFRDPRLEQLGWRAIGAKSALSTKATSGEADYAAHRIALGVPDSADLPSDQIFALDAGFEELNGVSFRKGCYVGQEVTARMKHRATARRRFFVAEGVALAPGASVTAAGKVIGTLGTNAGGQALALVRLDRWEEAQASASPVEANGHKINLSKPSWLKI